MVRLIVKLYAVVIKLVLILEGLVTTVCSILFLKRNVAGCNHFKYQNSSKYVVSRILCK